MKGCRGVRFSGGGAALAFSKRLVVGYFAVKSTGRTCGENHAQLLVEVKLRVQFFEKISANLVSSAAGLVSQCFQSGLRDTTTTFNPNT